MILPKGTVTVQDSSGGDTSEDSYDYDMEDEGSYDIEDGAY